MNRQPRAVQKAALAAARGKRGFGFLMEQGLGKTATALLEACELRAEEGAECMVTICPNSFKGGWEEEVHKWGFPVSSIIYESGSNTYYRREGFNNLILNFEAIRSQSTQGFIRRFVNGRKCYIVCDESVALSTYNASQTVAAIELAKEQTWRRILSGRWMRNGPDDTWAQMRFIGALDGVMYFPYRARFCAMGGFKGKKVMGQRPGTEQRFADLVNPWVFEALKKDWGLDIPKIYSTRDYKLTPEMQRHFDMMMNDFMIETDDETISIDVAIAKYEKMAQIQCGYIIREDGSVLELVEPKKNPRLLAFTDTVRSEISGKVAIPYFHKYAGQLLQDAFPKASYIRGGLTAHEISQQKLRFNEDANCREILLQIRSAKYGHTLLGDQSMESNSCANMAFFENTYSMDDRVQIEDRIHRDGQTAPAVGYTDFSGTVIDRSMVAALQRRYNTYDTLMGFVRGMKGQAA